MTLKDLIASKGLKVDYVRVELGKRGVLYSRSNFSRIINGDVVPKKRNLKPKLGEGPHYSFFILALSDILKIKPNKIDTLWKVKK